jgi:hypothetical protein
VPVTQLEIGCFEIRLSGGFEKMMYALLCLVSLAVFGFSYYQYTQTQGNTLWMVLMFLGILAAAAFGVMFLTGRVNKKEDIHITE